MCGKFINEGYSLEPLSNECWDLLEKKFGDISNWFVGECCFGGYCGAKGARRPDDWFELFIERRRHGKMQIKK